MFGKTFQKGPDRLGPELESVFASYSKAVQVPEACPEFMPALWARIEQRHNAAHGFRRVASRFVTAAAAICLMLSVGLWTPPASTQTHTAASYVDYLADDATDADIGQDAL